MLYTDESTYVPWNWCPLAFANGMEWSRQRRGRKDQFDNLYRKGLVNRFLWWCGAVAVIAYCPKWLREKKKAAAHV